MSSDDETKIAYLLGEQDGSLAAHERASLDGLRALLASPAVWVQPPASLEGDVVAAITRAAQAQAFAAGARRRSARRWLPSAARTFAAAGGRGSGRLVAIVIALGARDGASGPQHLAMVVSGTRLAPGGHGTARLARTPSGWEIKLAVTGLPHLAATRYYELGWRTRLGFWSRSARSTTRGRSRYGPVSPSRGSRP